jgi:succinate dehydrogenase hydrophobic anchor subunit
MDTYESKYAQDKIFKPVTGTALAVLSGLSFFFLAMSLPLVGPAGSRVPHAGQNKATFLTVLLITFALAVAATHSKMGCRRIRGGALPWFSLGMCCACLLTLFILLFNGFSI